jgi:hypothetical protein
MEEAAIVNQPGAPLLFAESEEFRDLAIRLTYSAEGAPVPSSEVFMRMAWWEAELLKLKIENDQKHPVLLMRLAKAWLDESVHRVYRLMPAGSTIDRGRDGL